MRFLHAHVDGHAFDLGHGRGDLEDLAVGHIAVGLEDHLAAAVLDAVGDGLSRLIQGDGRPSPWPRSKRGSAPGTSA